MNWLKSILTILTCYVIFSACNNIKHIPANDALYVGSSVKVDSTTLSSKSRRALESDLKGLVRPKPNKKFLGVRFKLSMYYLAGNPKKENSLMGWLKYKVGEPPVLLSQVSLERNVQVLQNTLENTGYFNAIVEGDTVIRKRKATAYYTAHVGERYFINEVHFDTIQDVLHRTINEKASETLLKPGDPFDLAVVKDERVRIDNELKERGYYYFDPELIKVIVDSSIGNHKVNLYVKVKPEANKAARQPYKISNIYVFPGYRLNATAADTSKAQMEFYKDYYVKDPQKNYKPKLFEDAIQFKTGEIYNRTDHNSTLSRIINLNAFRFVKNRLEVDPNSVNSSSDTAGLNTYYFLTASPRQSLRSEINASTKSNGLTGSNITLGWKKRNAFRAGEIFSIDATGGFEVQFGGQFKGYNTFRLGLQAGVSFPRFVTPFRIHTQRGGFVPRTNLKAGFDIYTKSKLYTLNSINTSIEYAWKNRAESEHKLSPLTFTYVQPASISEEYKDSILRNPNLATTVEPQFIIGPNYNYNYNEILTNIFKNGIYFNANLDLSGNIYGLIVGANAKDLKPKKLFGSFFSQYIRSEFDFRYYWKLAKWKVWVNRIDVGLSLPYGNSLNLPFVKQFFSGGTNSLRAFRSRQVGPGTYHLDENSNFRPDQGGDLKLEMNTELRAKLAGILHGAVFIDAGNVWTVNKAPARPGAQFSSDFLSELAVGAGVGLRFDVSFLVVRLDMGMPIRKPWYPKGERWVFNEIDFTSSEWKKQNLIFNLGIGYPF